ncbi:ATP-binding protein [Amylibacter kogurei]|uniref:ATP-binding protein n=1 Tax=Paramylibacter kogurei TaxID=1889778 RepID=A0A2G5K6J7_9RHOB|nr:ATP-binding protein [Amylibacter kogurei]
MTEFLDTLSDNALASLPWMFDFWALEHQVPPVGDWATWVILGGRGAGKTRAGAEWVRAQVEGAKAHDPGRCSRVALIGETIDQTREVMVFGDSGIMACSPPDRRPEWIASRKQLIWPNGATAQIVSAYDPESLRGPQFDCAWLDELAKWKKARETWDMLQFTLRLGDRPQQLVTTTPKNMALLKQILDARDTVVTRAPTTANRVNLAPSFLQKVVADYAGSRLGRQELDGELLEDFEGALWKLSMFDASRVEETPVLDRIVVAVDPPATSGKSSDACGIIVAGVCNQGAPQDWKAYVLADLSVHSASPNQWAQVAIDAFHDFGADRVVAEVNMGGEMVESVLRQQAAFLPYRGVRATRGKLARAEPVSTLYEQGRVHHRGAFKALEDQMCQMTQSGFQGSGSPDRVDALVWALTDLMVEPSNVYQNPKIRPL